jgi:DNA polymerase-1
VYDHECRDCSLWKGRRSVCVPGDGDLDAAVLIVGQAPGKEEDATGVPFVGLSGEVLREALKRSGVTKCFITNIAKCWPPGDRDPRSDESKACAKYLDDEIRSMPNLKVVVMLGNVPLQFFTGKKGILKKSGTAMPVRYPRKGPDDEAIPLTGLPIMHPAYVLRNEAMADDFLAHVKNIQPLLTGVKAGKVDLLRGKLAVRKIKEMAVPTRKVAFDLETTGLDPTKDSILAVSFYSKAQKHPVSCRNTHPGFLSALREFYQSPRPKVVQHVGFEAMWGELHLGVKLNNCVADTKIMSYRVDENKPANLASIAARYVKGMAGVKIDSQQALLMGDEWWSLDESTLGTRNAFDSRVAFIAEGEMARILGPEIMAYHLSVDIPIAIAVARMGHRGIALDRDRLTAMRKKYEDQKRKAEKRAKAVGIAGSLNSPQQLARSLLDLGLDTGVWGARNKVTGKSQMSTSEDALLDLVAEFPHCTKWVQPILDHREAAKRISTYIKGVGIRTTRVEGADILKASWWFPGTANWRTRTTNPNVQNMPRDPEYRSCVVSRYPNGWLVHADYSQAELRVLASLSGDPTMTEAFLNDEDIHGKTALKAYGRGYTKEQRTSAKTGNFAIIYGATAAKLSESMRIPFEEAAAIESAFKETYPRAWNYMQEQQFDAVRFGKVDLPCYGISRKFPPGVDKRADEIAREGANAPVSGGASMTTLTALAKVEDRLDPEESVLVLCVHDSLMADSRNKRAAMRAVKILRGAMLEAAEEQEWLTVPFKVDIGIGRSWGEQEEV